jgi:hypothetical protein
MEADVISTPINVGLFSLKKLNFKQKFLLSETRMVLFFKNSNNMHQGCKAISSPVNFAVSIVSIFLKYAFDFSPF